MKFNRKVAIPIIAIVMLAGLTTAAWTLLSTTSATGQVVSDAEVVGFELDFPSTFELNATGQADSELLHAEINNGNGNIDATVILTTNETNLNDECNPEGDVSYDLIVGGVSINSGDNITLSSGITDVDLNISVISRACPQNITSSVTIQEIA